MAATLKLVFIAPGQSSKSYFRRNLEDIVARQHTTRPEVTDIIGDAHRFANAESAIAFRDKFRAMYPNYTIRLEDGEGNPRFEREAQPQSSAEDTRLDHFIVPQGCEQSGLGFVVRAVTTPSLGRCYAMRACDVPSLSGMNIESVYSKTPEEAVARALAIWGALGAVATPYDHPHKAAIEGAEAKRVADEIQRSKQGPGRRRPGDQY